MSRISGWYGFTDTQLWEQLTRCEANMRALCGQISRLEVSRRKQLEWIEAAYAWSLRAVSICDELESRGLAPRGVPLEDARSDPPEFPTYQDAQGKEHSEF